MPNKMGMTDYMPILRKETKLRGLIEIVYKRIQRAWKPKIGWILWDFGTRKKPKENRRVPKILESSLYVSLLKLTS